MQVRDQFSRIETELQSIYLEREDAIRGLIAALLARQHVVLLGPPGAAKSAMVRELCHRITGATYFEWQVTRFTTPEELFGPVSLRALEQDSYRRVTTGKLPEAHIAYVDETFKANSAILNALLAIMEERLFHNDGAPQQVPLQTMVGASNELPEDREELGAMWDRFLLRYTVDYLRHPSAVEAMLRQAARKAPKTTISLADLETAQAQVSEVSVEAVIPLVIQIRQRLWQEQVLVSDRRLVRSLDLIRASAWLAGRTEAAEEDLAILAHALWQEPAQQVLVRQIVMEIADPTQGRILELIEQAEEVHATAMAKVAEAEGSDDIKQLTAVGMEAHTKMRTIIRHMERVIAEAEQAGRKAPSNAVRALESVRQMAKEVAERCLGLDI